LGRRSPAPAWLAELGARPPEIASSDAGLIYFSRHFRCRPGGRFPDGKWLLSPRGDLGYAGFMTFLGDNGTFAVVFSIPTWDRDLRGVLKSDAAFLIRSADEARTRAWRGERLDVSRRTGCFPLFMLVAAGATALSDPEIFRRTARRAAFLDRMAVFDDDQALQGARGAPVRGHARERPAVARGAAAR
jgi:hypothetical protein